MNLNFGAKDVRIEPWGNSIDVYVSQASVDDILDTIGKEYVINYFNIEEAE